MCGFVGAVFKRPLRPGDREAFGAAVRTLAHRGPDAEEVLVLEDARAILGFRRLAIIDLATGDQPMSLAGRGHLVFNGEIYNYRDARESLRRDGIEFHTGSDTEVLLHSLASHGVCGLTPLRGMFAFAYVDVERRRLVLARDRLGIKHLYVAERPEGVFFASEPKALLALPWIAAELDEARLPSYFTFRSVPAPGTLFKGITKLPCGTARIYPLDRLDAPEVETYWRYPEAASPGAAAGRNGDGALRAFEKAFLTSIERRLVSDVPVGAFLSGGLDSSLVVAGIHRLGRTDVRTFSATFPGSRDDESGFARTVADHFGLVNHQVPLRASEFLEELPRWVELNDDLVADASCLPLLKVSDRARDEGCIVMLSGEGADELFGGYGVYHKFVLLHAASRVVPARAMRQALARLARATGALGAQDEPRVREYLVEGRGFLGTAALLDVEGLADLFPAARNVELPRAQSARLADLGAFDFVRRIPDDLLVRTDRATMGASVEARVPFLDHDLVELVASLPDSVRSFPGISKVLLRRLARVWGVPWATITHRKIGFQLPIGSWFRGPLRSVWDEVLARRAIPGLRYDVVARVVEDHCTGGAQFDELLWRILALEAWHARWIQGPPLSWPLGSIAKPLAVAS